MATTAGLKQHGITSDTPEQIMVSAGAFYKNLHYNEAAKESPESESEPQGWVGTVLGATSGGGKVSLTPEYIDIEADGATVMVKGMKRKVGEAAKIEVNLIEFKESIVVDALHLKEDTDIAVSGYKCFKSKTQLEASDYLTNVAYVGTKVNGEQIIVILPNALITGAFEIEGKNKTQASFAITAECGADFTQDDLEHLPYEVYFPQPKASSGV